MKAKSDYTSIAISVGPLQPDDIRVLGARRTVRLAVPAAGCRVFCISGTIWLTEGTGGRDHILKKGESRTVSARGAPVLWAVEDAAFRCSLTEGPTDRIRMGSIFRRIKTVAVGLPFRRSRQILNKAKSS